MHEWTTTDRTAAQRAHLKHYQETVRELKLKQRQSPRNTPRRGLGQMGWTLPPKKHNRNVSRFFLCARFPRTERKGTEMCLSGKYSVSTARTGWSMRSIVAWNGGLLVIVSAAAIKTTRSKETNYPDNWQKGVVTCHSFLLHASACVYCGDSFIVVRGVFAIFFSLTPSDYRFGNNGNGLKVWKETALVIFYCGMTYVTKGLGTSRITLRNALELP